MLLQQWLSKTTQQLKAADVPSARLDTLVLLEDATGKERSWLLAHPEFELEDTTLLDKQTERRAKHEPLAYIRGKSEFYGRDFLVSSDTLEPRPETETIIDLLKTLGTPKIVADIGTGSGCLAVTTALEFPDTKVYATELNEAAIKIAQKNASTLNASVQFYLGSLLEPLIEQKITPDVVITNLPYVPDSHTINQAAMFEPKMAIFGGADGLDLYRQLFAQLEQLATLPVYILTESLPFQHNDLTQIAESASYTLKTSRDFIQVYAQDSRS